MGTKKETADIRTLTEMTVITDTHMMTTANGNTILKTTGDMRSRIKVIRGRAIRSISADTICPRGVDGMMRAIQIRVLRGRAIGTTSADTICPRGVEGMKTVMVGGIREDHMLLTFNRDMDIDIINLLSFQLISV